LTAPQLASVAKSAELTILKRVSFPSMLPQGCVSVAVSHRRAVLK
jgi:hypothetical protein